MNHVTREYLTKMLDSGFSSYILWVSLCVLYVINITSLCCPVFPVCHISAKQLLILDFASKITLVQIIRRFCVL